MSRTVTIAGWGYVLVCGVFLAIRPGRVVPGEPPSPPVPFTGDGGSWFAQIKPFCNAVEVEVQQQHLPPPAGSDGAGYAAACYALAGKIDRARR
jgi:hypothetical protein